MQENNWNQGHNSYQNPYQQPNSGQQMPPYGYHEPERKGFAIASLVLGILSLVLCCVGGGIFGIIGLILGILSLVKRESKMGMAIAGIITSSFGIVYGIVMLIYGVMMFGFITENYDAIIESEMSGVYDMKEPIEDEQTADNLGMEEKLFEGKIFDASDGSVIYFEEDGTFVWYQDETVLDDNYRYGSYDYYQAEFAESYIVTYLGEYGVTEEELTELYDRNSDSEFYTQENFTCLVLHLESEVLDGVDEVVEPYDKNYMGFFADGYYDAANMDNGNYISFTSRQ